MLSPPVWFTEATSFAAAIRLQQLDFADAHPVLAERRGRDVVPREFPNSRQSAFAELFPQLAEIYPVKHNPFNGTYYRISEFSPEPLVAYARFQGLYVKTLHS
jgi:hypothetical protein